MLTGRTIVCLSSIDWDFLWQAHQQVMASLAAAGNRVLFVESTGVRAPTLRDLPRLWRRLQGGGRGHGRRRPPDAVSVYSPVLLPFPYAAWARAVNLPLLERAVRQRIAAWGDPAPIVWSFLPTPLSRALGERLSPALSIFHCVDHLSSSSPAAARLRQSEVESFARADVVFVTSHALRDLARVYNSEVHLVPSGVDLGRFESVDPTAPLPEDLRDIARPVIGYLGGVHQWLDQSLLATLAERRRDWSFVLVGPRQTDVSQLERQPNVHLLGTRGPDTVPDYLRGFDVATVPYRLAEYTHHVYPVKLNEYLAMGLPVVSSPLAEVEHFNRRHDSVVAVAGTPEAFEAEIASALGASSAAVADARRAVARANSWPVRLDVMSGVIEDALAARVG